MGGRREFKIMNTNPLINTTDGCRIAYRFDGPADKPVLLLSNSIGTDLTMWDPGVKLVILPVVHLSNLEAPDAFTNAVLEFLR